MENKLPAYTVGSLVAKIKVEGMLATFEQIISSDVPAEKFKEFAKSVEENAVMLRLSKSTWILI